jgi:hypothetical protein
MNLLWRMVRASSAGDGGARDRFAEPECGPGAWEARGRSRCGHCGAPTPRPVRVRPLVLDWPHGEPHRLGDFTWVANSYDPVVSGELAEELGERFAGFEAAPVEPRDPPAALIDEARGLVELAVVRECRPEPARSTLRRARPPCPECGVHVLFWGESHTLQVLMRSNHGLTVLEGVEYWQSGQWDPVTKSLPQTRHPREEGRGLFLDAAELGDEGLFKIEGDNKAVMCTDGVKRFVESRGLTNVGFLCGGELVERAVRSS